MLALSSLIDIEQPFDLSCQIGDLNSLAPAKGDGFIGSEHDLDRSSGGYKSRPGINPLFDSISGASLGDQTGIAQSFTDLHQSIAIPTVQFLAPGLP
jgi:hypothetical protein